jgi:hypothetical protein
MARKKIPAELPVDKNLASDIVRPFLQEPQGAMFGFTVA